MTWSCVFTLDPHIRFFLGLCSVFKVQCLAILAFVLLPYRVDLYIIPRGLGYVNTFFDTFLRFFSETLGFVEKEACLTIAFICIKFSSKNLKKSADFSHFFSKKRRKSVKIFLCCAIFFVNFCLFFFSILRKSFEGSCNYIENSHIHRHHKPDTTSKTYCRSTHVSITEDKKGAMLSHSARISLVLVQTCTSRDTVVYHNKVQLL